MINPSRIPHRIAVPALLAVFVICGFDSLTRDSATFDETAHLAAGVSYLETGDFRLSPEHPPLARLIAAAPLVFLHRGGGDYASPPWSGQPASETDSRRTSANEWAFGFDLLNGGREGAPARQPAARLTPARCAILGLGVLLLLVVYAWARELFGRPAGLLALVLAVTCPTLLAHARLVTTDVPAALGFTATAWLVWRWLGAPTWRRAVVAGAALGAALLFKFSCLLLAPIILALTGIAIATGRVEVRRAATGFALIAAVAYLSIWAAYGFRFAASTDAGYVLPWQGLEETSGISSPVRFAVAHRLLPEAYLYGFAYPQSSRRVAYLDGEQSVGGWYRYFPEAFLLKTPVAFTALAAWVLLAGLFRTRGRSFDGWCVALTPMVFAALAIESRFNIGHRHLTPVYPFLCVGMAQAAAWAASRRWRGAAVATLVVACVVSFALATPRYLSYFNVVAGGPRGGSRHLVDSNLDWGQDLIRLRRWMTSHDVAEIDLAYFGTADPRAHGIGFRKVFLFIESHPEMENVPPASGRYFAASVTLLHGLYLDPDRKFAEEILRRGLVQESVVEAYLVESEARRSRGLPLVHLADWLTGRGVLTTVQRRDIEDALPSTWVRRVGMTLAPVDWAGDSIAIYRIP